jgi:5'-3' exoribonuclease 1
MENFEEEFADQNWYKGRQHKEIQAMEKARKRGKLSTKFIFHLARAMANLAVITKDQQKILVQVRKFVTAHQSKPSANDKCAFVNSFSAKDQRFLQELADSLHLRATWDETDEYGQPQVVLRFDMEGVSEDGNEAEKGENGEEEDDEWQSEDGDDEGDVAIQRVFAKYDKAKVVENTSEDFEESYEEKLKEKLVEWKRGYYKVSSLRRCDAEHRRTSSRSSTTSLPSFTGLSFDTSRVCSGS